MSGRPLVNLSLAVNYAFGGTKVWGYHLLNLSIHILAGLTLFGVVRRTLQRPVLDKRFGKSAWPLALVVAVLWTVHPLQTEVVTYVIQRAESLMGLFYLFTLYCFIRGTESQRPGRWFAFSTIACVLGMASKEVMASAPLMVLLYDRTFVAGSFSEAWNRRWRWYAGLACTWVVVAYLVATTGSRGGSAGFDTPASWWEYAQTQCWAIVHYLSLSVWPQGLVFDYGSYWVRDVGTMIPCALVLVALLAGTMLGLLYRPEIGFLGAWFLVILAPTSSVMPVASQTVAEHRMYLPLAAVVTMAIVGGCALERQVLNVRQRTRKFFECGASGVLVILLVVLTIQRNRDYRSELAIWQDTVVKCSTNPRAHHCYGLALVRAGRIQEAIRQYEQALKIKPDYAEVRNNLGLALVQDGRVQEAIPQYEEALRVDPDYAEAHNDLAIALFVSGKAPEALQHFERALQIQPGFAEGHNNFGLALLRLGRAAEAIGQFEQAVRINHRYADAHNNLGVALFQLGKIADAENHFRQALRLKPDYADARNNLARLHAAP